MNNIVKNKKNAHFFKKPFVQLHDTFTNSDIKLHDFINSYDKEIFDLSQKELARYSNVSEGSVSRFVNKIGFKSYREFIAHINLVIKDFYTNYLKNNIENLNQITRREEILLSHNFAVNSIVNDKTYASIEYAAELLYKAEKVFILTSNEDKVISSEFAYLLQKVGKHVIYSSDFDIFLPLLANASKNDVAVCFSDVINSLQIQFISKYLLKNGAKLITLSSDNVLPDDVRVATKIIYSKIQNPINKIYFSNKASQLLIAELLFDALVSIGSDIEKKYKKSKDMHSLWIDFINLKNN
ncbi:hypothetical protein VO56_01955 [Mycoplasmopsis gallinacea]|uniref:Uncharacterized protein n=1 Tax=Mycoplasmopsis gallinacea TaxID=29556 RepID=A0A0D5ZJE7_9BACT|nr:hypothetical protein VO56_01955 [Mycoplasmopsis gallinacea]